MADTDLENGTICFCLAPVCHISVLRLRREKLHELSPKNQKSLRLKKEKQVPETSPVARRRRSLCLCSNTSRLRLARAANFHLYWKTLLKNTQRHYEGQTTTPRLCLHTPAAWRVRGINASTSMGVKGGHHKLSDGLQHFFFCANGYYEVFGVQDIL